MLVCFRTQPTKLVVVYLDAIHLQAAVGDVGVIAEITDVEFMANGRANLQVQLNLLLSEIQQSEIYSKVRFLFGRQGARKGL
jgi:hypothetical protein